MQIIELPFMYHSVRTAILVISMVMCVAGCFRDYNLRIDKGTQPEFGEAHLVSADAQIVRTRQIVDESMAFSLVVLPQSLGSIIAMKNEQELRIQRFDTAFQSVWQKNQRVGDEYPDNITAFFHHKGEVILIESRQANDSLKYLETAYDARTGDSLRQLLLATIPWSSFQDDNVYYTTILSPDSSSFLLYGRKILDYRDMKGFRTLRSLQDKVLFDAILFSAAGKEIARRQITFAADSSGHLWNEHITLDNDGNVFIVNTRGRRTMEAERYNMRTGEKKYLAVELPGINVFNDDSTIFQSNVYVESHGRLSVRGIRKSQRITGEAYRPTGRHTHGLIHARFDFNRMVADVPVDLIPTRELAKRLFNSSRFELIEYRGWIPFSGRGGGCFALEWEGRDKEHIMSHHYALLAFDESGKELWQATIPKSQRVYFLAGSRDRGTKGMRHFERPAPNFLTLMGEEVSHINYAANAIESPGYIEVFYIDTFNNGVVRWCIRESDGSAVGPERIAWIPVTLAGTITITDSGIRRLSAQSLFLMTYSEERFDLNLLSLPAPSGP